MAKSWPLSGMLLAALAAGCVPGPAVAPSIAQLPGKVEPAAPAEGASLALTVKTEAPTGYRAQYINVVDWEVADGSLSNSDPTIPTLSRTAAATVDASLGRQGTLYFAPVKAAGNYTLTIDLKRRDRTGTYQTIATGTKASLTLSPGANTATVTLTPTANGQLTVSVPQPAPSFTPPPSITSAAPLTGSVGMLVTFSGQNLGGTTGTNTVKFNGATATVTSASTTLVTAEVPTGATTGAMTLGVPSWPAVGAGTFTVVASGDSLGNYGTGAGPYGMAIDASNNVWVANNGGSTVSKISPSGNLLGTYALGATSPIRLAIDAAGTVWVLTDTVPGKVVRLAADGTFLGATTIDDHPLDLDFDSSGNLWVAGLTSNVSKLSPTGALLATYPVGVAGGQCGGLAIDAGNNVWVTVRNANKLVKLAPNGSVAGTYSVGATPAHLEVDAGGNLWIALEGDVNVAKVAPSGTTTGLYNVGSSPRTLQIDSLGNVWVCRVSSSQVTKLSSAGTVLGTYTMGGTAIETTFDRTRAVYVSVGPLNALAKIAL